MIAISCEHFFKFLNPSQRIHAHACKYDYDIMDSNTIVSSCPLVAPSLTKAWGMGMGMRIAGSRCED